jgi:hypothetical protein
MPRVEQQIGAAEQCANLLHAGRLAEIGCDAALVGIEPGEISALMVPSPTSTSGAIFRARSPPGGSTLMTSAPKSANSFPQ